MVYVIADIPKDYIGLQNEENDRNVTYIFRYSNFLFRFSVTLRITNITKKWFTLFIKFLKTRVAKRTK